ncbi:MAG: SAM-dependent chlorinase/fluorinase [Planctomycetes bacterium]|nr:SAM-dependent chlorinase/fluorinase [Planctomycetota bacterium]
MRLPAPSGIVTLTTDFGSVDPYVAQMKGVVLGQCRRAVLVDVVHELPPQDIGAAAFVMASLVERFPAGTVHIGVVDPGVGSARRVLGVAAADAFWLAPDNGLLTALLAREDARALVIDVDALGIRPASRTFHGRDVFAPIAGRLAGGTLGFASLGPRCADPVRLAGPSGSGARVVWVDRYGNLITDLVLTPGSVCRGVVAAGREAPLVGCYADAAPGSLVSLVGSYQTVELALVGGSAARELGIGAGTPVQAQTSRLDTQDQDGR